MPGRFDLEVGAAAGGGTKSDEQLGEGRDRVGLCVGSSFETISPAESVVGDGVGRRWPAGWRLEHPVGEPAGLIGRCRGVVEQRARERWAWSFGLDLGDRAAGGGLVDDRLAVGERRDQGLNGEVVHQSGQAAGDLVDQRDRVV